MPGASSYQNNWHPWWEETKMGGFAMHQEVDITFRSTGGFTLEKPARLIIKLLYWSNSTNLLSIFSFFSGVFSQTFEPQWSGLDFQKSLVGLLFNVSCFFSLFWKGVIYDWPCTLSACYRRQNIEKDQTELFQNPQNAVFIKPVWSHLNFYFADDQMSIAASAFQYYFSFLALGLWLRWREFGNIEKSLKMFFSFH